MRRGGVEAGRRAAGVGGDKPEFAFANDELRGACGFWYRVLFVVTRSAGIRHFARRALVVARVALRRHFFGHRRRAPSTS